jgi:iron(III) transport system substrate-binding protein
MSEFCKTLAAATLLAGLLSGIGDAGAQQALTATEKIYADLAKLPAAERQKQLEAGAAKENRLNFVNHSGPRGATILRTFLRQYPFITESRVDASTGSAPDAAERLYNEETAGRHLTDVIVTASHLDFGRHFAKNLIARNPTPANQKILPRYKEFMDPDNKWVIYNIEEHGMSYNYNLVKPEDAPKAWDDLCNPKYKGKASYDPAEPIFLAGLWTMFGEDGTKKLLECIGKNAPIVQKGHSDRLLLMYAGDHWIQGDNFLYRGDFERKQAAAKGDANAAPFKAVYEAPVMASPLVGVINTNTPNPYTAALFVDWLLSDQVQEALLKENRAVPTRPHPFVPEGTKLVVIQMPPNDVMERLHGYWVQAIGHAR